MIFSRSDRLMFVHQMKLKKNFVWDGNGYRTALKWIYRNCPLKIYMTKFASMPMHWACIIWMEYQGWRRLCYTKISTRAFKDIELVSTTNANVGSCMETSLPPVIIWFNKWRVDTTLFIRVKRSVIWFGRSHCIACLYTIWFVTLVCTFHHQSWRTHLFLMLMNILRMWKW